MGIESWFYKFLIPWIFGLYARGPLTGSTKGLNIGGKEQTERQKP